MTEIILPYKPRPQFLPLHNRKERWAVVVAHRRAGKSVACINELIRASVMDKSGNGRYGYICPYYSQAKQVIWDYLKTFAKPIPGIKPNESELRLDFPNGSRIQLFGADNPDRLRGLYFDGIIADEYGDWKSNVWSYVIRPALADRKGWAVVIGTPKGKNSFYERYEAGQIDPNCFTLMLKASESKLLDDEEMAALKVELSEDAWLQEMECNFDAAIPGAIYGKELYELEEAGRVMECYDRSLKTYAAMDLGWSDDTSIWWYQVAGKELRVIDCYSNSGMPIAHYDEILKGKGYDYGEWLYLPHDAKAKSLQTGRSIEEQFRSLGWRTRIVPSISLMDGIQAARLTLATCWFSPKCKEGINALKQYQREYNTDKKIFNDRPKHDWTSHFADGFRYVALAWREQRPEVSKPKMKIWQDQTLNELWDSTKRGVRKRI